jgi:hypothetical protein
VVETQTNGQAKLEELRAKRNSLFEQFAKNPSEIRMAIKIKSLDDQIAESVLNCSRQRIHENKRIAEHSVQK